MAEYLTPGVYMEEFETQTSTINGVGTSTAGFVGMARRGQIIGKPKLVTGVAQFQKYFGSYLGEEYGEHRFLNYAVEQFFLNGGSSCYVMRVASHEQTCASVDIEGILKVTATSSGDWGNSMSVQIRRSYHSKTLIMQQVTENELQKNQYVVNSTVGFYIGDVVELNEKLYTITNIYGNVLELNKPLDDDCFKDTTCPQSYLQTVMMDIQIMGEGFKEVYEDCSLNSASPTFLMKTLENSTFVEVSFLQSQFNAETFYTKYTTDLVSYHLTGGTTVIPSKEYEEMYIGKDNGFSQRSGIQAFIGVDDVSIMAVPGITNERVQNALIKHCEKTSNCFAILDMPLNFTTVDQLMKHREQYDTTYAAMYHPWLNVYDILLKKNTYMPPSGAIAGIYARVDNTRGVWKAPANEIIRNTTGLSIKYGENEQAILNPKGVNLIRSFPSMGIRVWGARTCSNERNWKYINICRLLIYLEESIKVNTSWVIFEPNNELLWLRVYNTIYTFLETIWHNGGLVGASESEAFFVNVGKSTMTQDDILNGRFICQIGVSLVKPAEFIIFKVTQKMENISERGN